MLEIKVLPITMETVQCASYVCSDPSDVGLELADRGCNLKTQWAEAEIKKGFVPGFVAWLDGKPSGVFNLEHREDSRVVGIKCVWVPRKDHWDKGVASKILQKLISYAKTIDCFNGKPASAIIAQPFDGGYPEQKKWYEFLVKKGFSPTHEDNCILYYPIEPGYVYHKDPKKDGLFDDNSTKEYIPQQEDNDRIVVIENPIMCPYYHVFFAKAAAKLKEVKPEIQVAWLNSEIDSKEVAKRGSFRGMVVKGHKITAPSYNFDKFLEEAKSYLEK
ncbi:MAG: GNAT family N-acetyltransferase [Caldiserica bacterium]|nr:GNAT family N-acetyltransferase [Caldisericota bacterium]